MLLTVNEKVEPALIVEVNKLFIRKLLVLEVEMQENDVPCKPA
jgi:hypothetical protein